MISRLDSAVLYSWAIIDNDFSKFHCTCYLNDWPLSHAHQDKRSRTWCGDYARTEYISFSLSLMIDDQCGNNSRPGTIIQANTVDVWPIAVMLLLYPTPSHLEMQLQYGRGGGPNISKGLHISVIFGPGGPNILGVQIFWGSIYHMTDQLDPHFLLLYEQMHGTQRTFCPPYQLWNSYHFEQKLLALARWSPYILIYLVDVALDEYIELSDKNLVEMV